MTALAQGAAGLAVALGFALLCMRRATGMTTLCAAQAVIVAVAALAQGEVLVAAVALAEAGALWWLGRFHGDGAHAPRVMAMHAPHVMAGEGPPSTTCGVAGTKVVDGGPSPAMTRRGDHSVSLPGRGGKSVLAAAAVLAGLAVVTPGAGLPLAVILLGLLLVASRSLPSHQALGIAVMQNGLVLAALTANLSNGRLFLAALPWLPALAFGALWLGIGRARTARLQAPHAAWIDIAVCSLALLLAFALPWQLDAHGPFWRIDALAAHVIVLLAALATATSWARRHTSPVWGSGVAILAGTALAVVATAPLLSWLGMALATTGAVAAALPARAEAWRRLRLGCTGLGLALFGVVSLHAAVSPPGLPATACAMLGYGVLAVLAPELTIAAAALILRMRDAAPADPLLLTLGLAALLVAALGLAVPAGQRRTLALVGLAQGGAAVFAFGLGTEAGNLAGLLQLSLLTLTQCALLLARQGGLDRLAAYAGLAGLPPFGLFPSLALILLATTARLPWLLLPLGAGLAAVAWSVLLRLPAAQRPPAGKSSAGMSPAWASPAWLPLTLLLIAGFALPASLLAWFRLAAR